MKKALITGITGQDGSYLAELLLSKDYEVHGLVRSASSANTHRIDHILPKLHLHQGDMGDALSLKEIITSVMPHEIYNLAAMSHVKASFNLPEYTANIDALGVLRLLEITRLYHPNAKIYQASTSELFGKTTEIPQTETTPFHPRSPYGIAKLYAYWAIRNYREAYGLFASNGILFNHESPRRGELFVTRKISSGVAKISKGLQKKISLGNLDALRDWGFAKDYAEGMWAMLQLASPDDFILATGVTASVRQFVELSFLEIGIPLLWEKREVGEVGLNRNTGEVVVEVDAQFLRPAEVDILCGDSSKAFKAFGWKAKTSLEELVKIMVRADISRLEHASLRLYAHC